MARQLRTQRQPPTAYVYCAIYPAPWPALAEVYWRRSICGVTRKWRLIGLNRRIRRSSKAGLCSDIRTGNTYVPRRRNSVNCSEPRRAIAAHKAATGCKCWPRRPNRSAANRSKVSVSIYICRIHMQIKTRRITRRVQFTDKVFRILPAWPNLQ